MLLTTTSRALRAAGARAWLPVSSGAALQHQLFSTSPAHRATNIITFGETSNPALSELLDNFRQKVILPTYLATEDHKKLYKRKYEQALKNDPIMMEIDGVVHKFGYLDRMEALPSTRKTFVEALNLMKTYADFQNIRPLLEGCVRDKRTVSPARLHQIIRALAGKDCLPIVIDCARAAERTGMKLNHSEIINELLTYIQKPAIMGGFTAAKTRLALQQVSAVVDMIETDANHKPTVETEGAFPFYRDPQVLAARLHMAAAQAVYHQEGKDLDGKVAKYADELVKLWPENAGLLDLQPDASYQDNQKMKYILGRSTYLWFASPVLNGLTLAAQVVDPGLAMQLQNRADAVEQEIKTAVTALVPLRDPARSRRGEILYNALFNTEGTEGNTAEE